MKRPIAVLVFALLVSACSKPAESTAPDTARQIAAPEEIGSKEADSEDASFQALDSLEFQWEVDDETIEAAPKLGDMAPDFTLEKLGGGTARLSDAFAQGPVVLLFGSFTCPPFRVKTPEFEDLAKRLEGKVQFFIVYSREAHPQGADAEGIDQVADGLIALDADGDGATTLNEFRGPRLIFEAFDLDGDGCLVADEFETARSVTDFASFPAPSTADERMQAAARFRSEVPGHIPVVIDTLDNTTSLAYGGLPNSAFVIGRGGAVKAMQAWANVRGLEAVLAALVGRPEPQDGTVLPDWDVVEWQLKRARADGKRLLIGFMAPGCSACADMNETVLVDPRIEDLVSKFEYASLDVAEEDAWKLFETLEFTGTPAFVILSGDGKIVDRTQGFQGPEAFAKFLQN